MLCGEPSTPSLRDPPADETEALEGEALDGDGAAETETIRGPWGKVCGWDSDWEKEWEKGWVPPGVDCWWIGVGCEVTM